MPRTTLALDPSLLRQLKVRAARQGTTLQDVANQLLRQALATPAPPPSRLRLPAWDGVQNSSVDLFDRRALMDWTDGLDGGSRS